MNEARPSGAMSRLLGIMRTQWFLVGIVLLIPGGLLIGWQNEAAAVNRMRNLLPSQYVTWIVLFLMAFSLDSRQLTAAFRRPLPVFWAVVINAVMLPLLGWAVISMQSTPDFRIGVMIAATVPSTLAACSVWTRKAGGNDAVSLLTTIVTNSLCFLTAPFWLRLATAQDVKLNTERLMEDLLLVVLLPTLTGQLVRQIRSAGEFAARHKTPIGVVAQSCILCMIFLSACGGGIELQKSGLGTQITGLVFAWLTCVTLHVFALFVSNSGAKLMKFDRKDRIGAVIAGSQKTLPIGVYLATSSDAFGGPEVVNGMPVPFAVFPILMFHVSQLFIDTVVADRFAREGKLLEEKFDQNKVDPQGKLCR